MVLFEHMTKKSPKNNTIDVEKEMAIFLKNNPEIQKSLEIFDMSLKEYNEALDSSVQEKTIINFKNTAWLPGTK